MLFIGIKPDCTFFVTMFIYRNQELIEYDIFSVLRHCRHRIITEICLAYIQTYCVSQVEKIVFMDASDYISVLFIIGYFRIPVKRICQNLNNVRLLLRNDYYRIIPH